MPGYIIHLAEAERIIEKISGNFSVTDDWRNKFLTGCLLPDTKPYGKDKRETHFWNEEVIPNLARKPDTKIFLEKYKDKLENPIVSGYYAHLLLDVHFIDIYWKNEFYFMDENRQEEKLYDKVKYVRINETGEVVPVEKFLSLEYYYGDYSAMNEYYIQKYNIKIPVNIYYDNPIKEADISQMDGIYYNLKKYCLGGKVDDIKKLRVFNIEKLSNLIDKSADEFCGMFENNFTYLK